MMLFLYLAQHCVNDPNTLSPAISALAGAVIGGAFPAFIAIYNMRNQRKTAMWEKKIADFDNVYREFLSPLLNKYHMLKTNKEINNLTEFYHFLFEKQESFFLCRPKQLRIMLREIYVYLDRKHAENNGEWTKEDFDLIMNRLQKLEDIINKTLDTLEI
jgi:hypothetical protein